MNAFVALLQREWWEHRAGFFWAPLAILAIVVLIAVLSLLGGEASVSISYERHSGSHTEQAVRQWNQGLMALLESSGLTGDQSADRSAQLRYLLAQPFVLTHLLVAVFMLLGALHDERRDRSVLFYKSLPVSDAQTVLSKLVLAVWIAPMATIAAIVLAQLSLLSLFSLGAALQGAPGAGLAWRQAGVPGGALELFVGYLLQGLWTLPVYAWLLLVSAAAPRVPFLWATLIPLLLVALESVLLGGRRLYGAIGDHLSLRALPRPPPLFGEGGPAVGLAEQLALLGHAQLWLGVALGAVFLAGATWLRRRNAEL
jgi:ABC-2 type transport system permease protein